MIIINAILKLADGKGEELEKAFRKAVPLVLKDPGAITYALHRSINDPNKYFVYEKYEDQEAVSYHASTDHFKEFFKVLVSLLDGSPDIEMYNEVE